MKPAAFRYHAPKTLDEAVAVLAEVAPDDGRVLAGGQSLVPAPPQRTNGHTSGIGLTRTPDEGLA
jgi:CO/xanthine dehydrogenase FAD-binding subunit